MNLSTLTVAEVYDLPSYPYDIADCPDHPLYTAWQWDQEFMRQLGWNWCQFYGSLKSIRTGVPYDLVRYAFQDEEGH